jgi:5-formyltetrahydrofolate cyclo-ligase
VSGATAVAGWPEIRAWRKRTREALLEARVTQDPQLRIELAQRAKDRLLASVDLQDFESIGLYWPIRGEIDLRDFARAHCERGGVVALPVVVERGAPVEFWRWQPGARMSRGLWNIPVPAERALVAPDALVVPLVGFDAGRYRLGYGGGYYDRTLAAAPRRPFCVGLGYSAGRLDSIFPQSHDIPMDVVITEDGVIDAAD